MKEKRFTYHYVIIIACFIMMAATVGITVNTFTIISPAMIEDLGITATQAQLISLVSTLANMVAGLFVGKLMAKFGMRKTMTVGTILMCGGFALRGAASTMLTLCASNFVCGLGMAEISTIPSGVLVNNWFSMEKKGTMSGIAFTGSVAGGILFVQVATALMKVYDWRVTHYVLAAVCAVLMLPISMFVVRARPEEKGLCPLGSENAAGGACPVVTGISAKRFFRTGTFWLLAFTVFVVGFTNMGIQRNFAICLQNEHGHSEDFASMVYSLVNMFFNIGVAVGAVVAARVFDVTGSFNGAWIAFAVLMVIAAFTTVLSARRAREYRSMTE